MQKYRTIALALILGLCYGTLQAGERCQREDEAVYYILRESNNELLAAGSRLASSREDALFRILRSAGRMASYEGTLPANTKVLIWFKFRGITYRVAWRTPERRWHHWGRRI